MIFEYLLERFKDEDLKKVFALSLLYGLAVGLVFGLLYGLAFSLVYGLVLGLVLGFVLGFAHFINFFAFLGLASLISHYPNPLPLWVFFVIIFILIEVFFWSDKQKPKKNQNKITFTLLKKGEALLETIMILGYANLIRLGIEKISKFQNWDVILRWVGYIGAGIIILIMGLGIIYLYIKLNSLKYRK